MRNPERLAPLIEQGVIEEVLRPLMSGKEADVFLVLSAGEARVAKVYKDAQNRSFKQRSAYAEGRKVRNSRQRRAMAKHTRYGKAEEEAAWRSAEVDAIYRLAEAGVRVPHPHDFVDGVLVMELITGPDGGPAPRLVDVQLTRDEAIRLFHACLREVVRMLCAGIVHGDLSDFNILLEADGPVIIDFPQAVDPAHNRNARRLLVRDVRNLQSFLARYAPNLRHKKYGEEMWELYERNQLHPDTQLTGRFRRSETRVDMMSLLDEIEHAEQASRARREALGLPPPRRARTPKASSGPAPAPLRARGAKAPPPKRARAEASQPKRPKRRRGYKPRTGASSPARPPAAPASEPPLRSLDDLDALLSIDD